MSSSRPSRAQPQGAPLSAGPDVAIRASHLSKVYRLYARPQDRLTEMFLAPFGRRRSRDFIALEDVSFDLPRGQAAWRHRPQRLGQEHAAADSGRHPARRRGEKCRSAAASPRCWSLAADSTRSSPAARTSTSTPRFSACRARRRKHGSTRSRRSPISAVSWTSP